MIERTITHFFSYRFVECYLTSGNGIGRFSTENSSFEGSTFVERNRLGVFFGFFYGGIA